MRSITARLAMALGVTVALALSGVAQPSAAQTSGAQKRTTQQSTRATQPREPSARAARAQAAPQEQGDQRSGEGASSGLVGYSARPEGMCWYSQGAGGHDLSGHWERCRSTGP